MIYQLSQISNRDTQVLYFYRILRHSSTELNEMFRYTEPSVFQMPKPKKITIDESEMYEYSIPILVKQNRIPYLEFNSKDESELKHIEDLIEVELKKDNLLIRGYTDKLTESTEISLYWVPSLATIRKIQDEIERLLASLGEKISDIDNLISGIQIRNDYVLNLEGLIPNLVNIGENETSLIYDDSHYRLSGSLAEQQLVNPTQNTISGLLKSHNGILTIHNTDGESKIYQGFYGGCLRLSGFYNTLVLCDITSIIYLTSLTANHVLIRNCPAVLIRDSIDNEGYSNSVSRLEIRNSYVTIYQSISIDSVWCYQRSTLVQKMGSVGSIESIEAGSTYVFDSPSEFNTIDKIPTKSLQGMFYTINPPREKEYLDEVFLAQKPIAFQRSQPEDPVPISQAEVSIYLKHTSSSGFTPIPTPSGDYSPFTEWYWSGDSRVEQMIAATGTDGRGYGGKSLPTLITVQSEIESEGSQHNIILWWGVNGLDYPASEYADVYKNIANSVGNDAKVFVGTVGYCPNGTGSGKVEGGAGQDLAPFNQKIEEFNKDLKQSLVSISNIIVLDIDAYIHELVSTKGAAWVTSDNLHYRPDASRAIYAWVCNQITNVEPGDIPDAPTSTHAGVIWNWLKNAGISNVSDRPELIAGILGNFQQESYLAIDVLGSDNQYYGPWCESNSDFRNYVLNQGFSFHPYTPNPGDESAAIPAVMTWLTQRSDSWNLLARNIDKVANQTGVLGAESFAELFAVCVERCIYGQDSITDSGVQQIQYSMYKGTIYEGITFKYQDLVNRRQNASKIYKQFMGS